MAKIYKEGEYMAEITVPIKLDISYVLIDVLRKIESDRDDYMYMQGFYD